MGFASCYLSFVCLSLSSISIFPHCPTPLETYLLLPLSLVGLGLAQRLAERAAELIDPTRPGTPVVALEFGVVEVMVLVGLKVVLETLRRADPAESKSRGARA